MIAFKEIKKQFTVCRRRIVSAGPQMEPELAVCFLAYRTPHLVRNWSRRVIDKVPRTQPGICNEPLVISDRIAPQVFHCASDTDGTASKACNQRVLVEGQHGRVGDRFIWNKPVLELFPHPVQRLTYWCRAGAARPQPDSLAKTMPIQVSLAAAGSAVPPQLGPG